MLLNLSAQVEVVNGPEELVTELKTLLDKPNPDFAKMKRMGYPTHDINPRIRMYDDIDGQLFVPRCTLSTIRQLSRKYNIRCMLKDNRTVVDPIDIRIKDIDPFWYQSEAIEVMEQQENGIVVAPCGAGKTIIGLLFIAKIKKPTLILVHTLELFKQWEDVIRNHLVLPGKIGKIGSGHKSLGDITIAMIQTLVKFSDKEWKAVNDKFEIFIGDEAHHFGADSYMKIMKRNSAKYSIGLTATPNRRDKKDFIIHNYLGNIIYEITDEDLRMMGRSLNCHVKIVDTNRTYNYTKMNELLPILNSAIAKDQYRNNLILNSIMQDMDDGRKALVLVDRVIQGKILYGLLKGERINSDIISGQVDKDRRSIIKEKMQSGNLDVLIANKAIAAEGLDIPIIDSVHICFMTSNIPLIKQMIGRGRRPYEDKEYCRVWLYKDKICRLELDGSFNEKLCEIDSFKYAIHRTKNWFISQNFKVEDHFGSILG